MMAFSFPREFDSLTRRRRFSLALLGAMSRRACLGADVLHGSDFLVYASLNAHGPQGDVRSMKGTPPQVQKDMIAVLSDEFFLFSHSIVAAEASKLMLEIHP